MHIEPRIEGVCRLADRGVIRARGADAAAFLQSQLSNDVLGLDHASARLAAFCSAKGRMQASFVVWRNGSDEFHLACAKDLLAATLKRLSMFVLRAKCKLDDASGEVALWGLAGVAAGDALGAGGAWQRAGDSIRLPAVAGLPRALRIASATAEAPPGPALALDAWNALEVRSGIVTIVAATVDRFVPQMVNYELVGGVDFQKGCYPGQEVVARSQYRGTTKRRVFGFMVDGAPAAAGDEVWAASPAGHDPAGADDPPGEPVGTVANAAMEGASGSVALVELRLAAIAAELRLGRAGGPALRRFELPYAVPIESEAAARAAP